MSQEIKLTQFSHGAGCGCKIAPAVLDKILHSDTIQAIHPQLLVGNDKRDDAAVFDLGNGSSVISTTDFFMPIVDDPFEFGRIASANAISDVYAMGGDPIMAIAILGWPVGKIPEEVAAKVLEGARAICAEAGIPLAGGHSIDSPEPIFGLAVTGMVSNGRLKQNSTGQAGDLLFLTKPLGIGAISTAQKKGWVTEEDLATIVSLMTHLNKAGAVLSAFDWVHAMTDVTGFGLLGHLSEMCEGSGLTAEIWFDAVPAISVAKDYIEKGSVPGGTHRNWASYGHKIAPLPEAQKLLLADPQTSGGLLIAIDPAHVAELQALAAQLNVPVELNPIGKLVEGPLPIRVV